MVIESHELLYDKFSGRGFFEFKQMSPRQFGPYTLVKNHLIPYEIYECPEMAHPYIYDFEEYFDENYKYIVIGLIRKSM